MLFVPIWANEMQMLNWNDFRGAPDIYIDFTNSKFVYSGGESRVHSCAWRAPKLLILCALKRKIKTTQWCFIVLNGMFLLFFLCIGSSQKWKTQPDLFEISVAVLFTPVLDDKTSSPFPYASIHALLYVCVRLHITYTYEHDRHNTRGMLMCTLFRCIFPLNWFRTE